MLAGSFTSFSTRFTAFTASPSEASGARLKESVTTGNWPWWLMVMGALVSSIFVKAESGTCPPLGNCAVDWIWEPPKLLSDAIVADSPGEVAEERLALAAVSELVGPNNCVAEDPPDTRPPDAAVEEEAFVRIYRSRRFNGSTWKSGLTSSTT